MKFLQFTQFAIYKEKLLIVKMILWCQWQQETEQKKYNKQYLLK